MSTFINNTLHSNDSNSICLEDESNSAVENIKPELFNPNNTIVATSTSTTCGLANGTATVETFSLPVAQISWSNGVSGNATATTITGLTNGIYSVTVSAPPLIVSTSVIVGYEEDNIIEASRNMGAADADLATDIAESKNGEFISVGYVAGPIATYGGIDGWVTVRNQTLNVLWENAYGGSNTDRITKVLALDDGYMLAGHTLSNDGTVPATPLGIWDIWLTKIDFSGTVLWSLKYGGNNTDFLNDIIQTCDGGFLMVGATASSNLGSKGGYDYYTCKITASGAINWRTIIGGSFDDHATSAVELPNGNFAVIGYSESNDGDVSNNYNVGTWDWWLAELDASGTFVGGRNYGGTGSDQPVDMIGNQDGSVWIIGYSNSVDGEAGNTVFGGNDYLLMQIQPPSTGNSVLYTNKFGGSGSDIPASIVRSGDGGLLIGGSTSSSNGTVQSGNNGGTDYWLTKFSTNPVSLEWEKTYGSNPAGFNDDCAAAIQASDGGYAMVGTTLGNVNFGLEDFWGIVLDQEPSLSVNIVVTNSCGNLSNGTATANPTGGSPIYLYNWSTGATTATVTGLAAGSYTVSVSDANGCVIISNVGISNGGPMISLGQNPSSCPGPGTVITTNISGGTAPYTYIWSTGATTPNVSNLDAGVVYLTVTDATGCSTTANAIAFVQNKIDAFIKNSETFCSNSNAGAFAAVKNPTGNYNYAWSDGQVGANAVNLPPGEIYVDISSSSNACKARRYYDIIQDSRSPVIRWVRNFGGTEDDAAQDIKETSDGNFIIAGQTRSSNGDISGPYRGNQDSWILKIDNSGSIIWEQNYGGSAADFSTSIVESGIDEYSFVSTSGSSDFDVSGNNGLSDVWVVNINGTGGINWEQNYGGSQGEFGSVIRTQSNNELVIGAWSNSNNIDLPSNNGNADFWLYTVNQFATKIISKNYGGSSTDFALDLVKTSDGGYIMIGYSNSSNIDVSSNNGGFDVWVVKYNRFGNIMWENNYGGTASDFGSKIIELKDCSGYVFLGYTESSNIDVSSNNGMSDIWLVKIDLNGGIVWEQTYGGSDVDLGTELRQTGDHGYLIGGHTASSNGDVSNHIGGEDFWLIRTDINGAIQWEETYGGTSNDRLLGMELTKDGGFILTGFSSSNDVNVPGNKGLQDILVIKLDPPINPTVTATKINPICSGAATGSINLTVVNGELPYTFQWSNGATTEDLTGLVAGNYIVTVTEANGCSSGIGIPINAGKVITITTTPSNPTCFNDGFINVTLTNAAPPITYNWSNGATTQNISNLAAGNYFLTVTDGDGCIATASQSLVSAAPLIVSTTSNDASCFGGTDASGTANPTGGATPYTYQWSANTGNQTTQTATGLSEGTYTVTVYDSAGCSATGQVAPKQPNEIVVTSFTIDMAAPCNAPGGDVSVNVTGGVFPYVILWPNGMTGPSTTMLNAGWNTVTITDNNGCQDTTGFNLTTLPPPVITSVNAADATCGQNNGSISIVVSGDAPITYQWSNGGGMPTINNLPPGTYSVTVTDATTCTVTSQINISNSGGATTTVDQTTQPLCGDNGSISVTTIGGTPPYTFNWSNGATTEDITGLAGGTYSLTATDANNCSTIISETLNTSPQLFVSGLKSNVVCNGASTGNIFIQTNSGTSPYTHIWSTGATTKSLNNIPAGSYSTTVTDANGCTETYAATITEPAAISIQFNIIQSPTCGNSDGSLSAMVSGGNPTYDYLWSTSAITPSITGLTAGIYTITVTDNFGCIETSSFSLPGTNGPAVSTAVIQPACGNDGSIALTVAGGATPYTYNWSNGETTPTITGLNQGTYSVTVTDNNSCVITTSETLNPPTTFSATNVNTNLKCNNDNSGSIDLTITGTTGPYTFNWSNGANTEDITGLAAGNYQVTVTDSNGCTETGTTTLTEPPEISVTLNQVQPSTCGNSDGIAEVITSGGTGPLQLLWSNGATTATITGLSGSTYTITVTDDNSCIATGSVNINDLGGPTVFTTNVIQPACAANGSITIGVTGGATPYSYNWSNGATTTTISGLAGGTYVLTVTDNIGCTSLLTEVLTASPDITLSNTNTDLLCNNDNSGAIDLTVTGGTTPFTINWSNGANTEDITGLAAGNYQVSVSDANGCSATLSTTINEPPVINLQANQLQPSTCGNADGQADAMALGGTSPFQYLWSNAATTQLIIGLASGTYTLTVTDNNGCTATESVSITDLGGPTIVQTTIFEPSCDDDGEISVTATGGVTPYSYNWSNGETTQTITGLAPSNYEVTITDVSGCSESTQISLVAPPQPGGTIDQTTDATCFGDPSGSVGITVTGGLMPYSYNWSNGAMTEDISGLTPGIYTITFTDSNNCNNTLTATINSPSELLAVATPGNPSTCGASNGDISVSASGATPPYSYQWSNGATTTTVTGLFSGSYFVTVLDINGCIGTDVAIVNDIGAPTADIINGIGPSCLDDGALTVSVSGGTMPYSYNWSNGGTTATTTGLSAGTYFVTVLDDSGCIVIKSEILNAAPLPSLTVANSQDVSCNGFNDGYINLQINSGTAPYNYVWSNSVTTQNISNLAAGIYTVTVTDAASCTATLSQQIFEPSVLTAVATQDNQATCGNSNGQASVQATGGTTPYSYSWSTGATTTVISGLFGGVYSVTVQDDNLCQAISSVTIVEPALPIINGLLGTDPDCGATNGSILVLASGSNFPLMYSIDMGTTYQPGNQFNNLGPGFYTLFLKDALDCIVTDTITLTSESAPVITAVNTVSPICLDSSGSIEIIANPTSGVTYSINGGTNTQPNPLFPGLPAGTYFLLVEDINGCQGLDTVTLTDIAGPAISNVAISEPNCGQADGAISITATGGTTPLEYSIDGGINYQPLANFNTIGSGTYNIVVRDFNGCKTLDVAVLTDQPGVVLDSVSVVDSSCDSTSGSIIIHAAGNNAPYQYSIDNGGNYQLSNTFSNVAPGQYSIIVLDTSNCQATTIVNVNYNPPPTFVLLQGISDTYCGKSIGSITIFANGGTPPLEYTLSGSPYQSSNIFSNLAAGFYTIMVRDSNGCEISRVEEILDLPGPTVSLASSSPPACGQSTGSVTFSAVQGLPPYEYSLNNGPFTTNNTFNGLLAGAYTVIVSDLNDCRDTLQFTLNDIPPPTIDLINQSDPTCGNANGAIIISASGATPPFSYAITGYPQQGSNVFNNLAPNTYVVTLSDANGCTATDQVTLIDQGGATITNYTVVQPTCGNANGSITVETNGGTLPLLFSVNGGNLQTSDLFTGLSAGMYDFTVQDANGCITTDSYQLQDIPGPVIDTIFVTEEACNQGNGSITINVSSGTPSFEYSIDNGSSYQTSNTFSGLSAGTLLILVKDVNGCTVSTNRTIQNIAAPTVTNILTTDPDCGATNGEATVQLSAGTPPFSYAWNTLPPQTGMTAIGLDVGTYSVTVTDANNCIAIDSAVISEPIIPFVDLGSDEISCVPPNTFIDAMNVGADYVWSTGDSTQTIDVLNYGVYTVTVTAANGCTGADEIEFIDSQYNPQIMNDTSVFFGNTIQLSASGGDDYEWWPGVDLSCVFCPDPDATPIETTIFFVEISTFDGCKDTLQVVIDVDQEVTVPDVITPNDDGTNDTWIIPHIENFPYNRLTIVNRWGDVVFNANPYTNNWNGTMNGKPLPQGTYYYLLETDVNMNNPKKGTITILK